MSLSPAEAREQARAIGLDGEARGIAVSSDRLVAVGRDGDGQPAIWTSSPADGEFAALSLGGAFAGAELHGVAHARGTYYALGAATVTETVRFEPASTDVGGAETYEFAHERRVPAVWRSDDARSWERHLLEAEVDGNAILTAAASDGDRIVAVGSRLDDDAAEGIAALVMVSEDGRAWKRARIASEDAELIEGGLTGVTAHDGSWAAVGGHIEGGAVLSSGDGESWRVWDGADAELRHLPLQGIVAAQGALIAAGTGIEDAEGVLLTSDDAGRSWGRGRAQLRSLNRPDATVKDLAVPEDGQSLLAVGAQGGEPAIERGQTR